MESMKCPYCGENGNRVVDSRSHSDDGYFKRRRECIRCQKRWNTIEISESEYKKFQKNQALEEKYKKISIMYAKLLKKYKEQREEA